MSAQVAVAEPSPEALAAQVAAARTCLAQARFESPHESIGALLAQRAAAAPAQNFLTYCDEDAGLYRRWSYAETADRAARTAALLRGLGARRGSRIAFLIGNLDHTIALYLATWSLGACVVPLSAAESEERKAFILENSRSLLLFARTEHGDEARRLARRLGIALILVRADDPGDRAAPPAPAAQTPESEPIYPGCAAALAPDPLARGDVHAAECEALLVYTSGTTGPPKGVLLDQRNLLADADALCSWHGWNTDTRALCVLPVHHVNGIIVSHVSVLHAGGSTVLHARFSSRSFWRHVAQEAVTMVSLVPTLLEFLLEADRQGEGASASDVGPLRLRSALCGAGPLRVDTALAFEARFGVPIAHGYGLSETTAFSCQLPADLAAHERTHWLSAHGFPSIGCAVAHCEMAILRPDASEAEPGERGEICIRGDIVSLGYHERPEANRAAFRSGWFCSGDEGFALRDANGRAFYFITGRIKELIIRGGVNYSPLEIDEVLAAHPSVRFALALPFENRYYGEEIAAYVVPHAERALEPDELLAWCREQLGFARAPKLIVMGDEIPYTTTGKPKRIELAQRLAASLAQYRDVQFRDTRTRGTGRDS